MKRALIEPDGRIAQIVELADEFSVAKPLQWVTIEDHVTTEDRWDGDEIKPAEDVLAKRRALQLRRIEGIKQGLLNHDLMVDWNGATWNARETDQNRLLGAVLKLALTFDSKWFPEGIPIPTTIPWWDNANVRHELTPEEGFKLHTTMQLAMMQVFIHEKELSTAIATSDEPEKLDW